MAAFVAAIVGPTRARNPRGGAAKSQNLVGGNLSAGGNGSLSYEGMPIFKNQVRQSHGFTDHSLPNSAGSQVAADASGWPSVAFNLVLFEGNFANVPWLNAATSGAPMKCGYIGSGTVSSAFGTIANFVAGDGTTTYSTFDFYGFNNSAAICVLFSAAAKNIFMYLPAYPGAAIDDPTAPSSLTNEIVALWKHFKWLRDMEASNAGLNNITNSSSTRRSASNTQANQNWAGTGNEGYPKEWWINLVKTAGIGHWCNLPSSDDGTNNSAGSYCAAVLNLHLTQIIPTGQPVVYEFSNEVWNGLPGGVGGVLGTNAVAHGFASSTSDFTGIYQYFAYLHHKLADMCRSVFGANFGPGKQVQIYCCNQLGGNGISSFNTILAYMNSNFGAPNADIQGLGLAPYMNLSNNAGDTSPALVLSDLAAQAVIAPYGGTSGAQCEHVAVIASHYNMKLVMYEGQFQANAEATNSNIPTVLASTSLTPVLQSWGHACLDAWFENLNFFTVGTSQTLGIGPYSDELGTSFPPSSANSPQLAAIQSLAAAVYAPQRNLIISPGDAMAGFSDDLTGASINLESNITYLPSFAYSMAGGMFRTSAARTWTVKATAAGSGTVNVEIDGVTVASGVAISTGLNTLGNFALSAGKHSIVIGANSFQAITAVSPPVFN